MNRYFYSLLFAIFLILSCSFNPERDNPLDPSSKLYKGTALLSGKIYSFYAPYQPLSNGSIFTIPGFYGSTSDASGEFEIKNIPFGHYKIVATKNGYAPDTLQTTVSGDQPNEINFHLDALPQFSEIKLFSYHVSQWWPTNDIYYLHVALNIDDKDGLGDISSVIVQIPITNGVDTLKSSIRPGYFEKVYREEEIPINHLQELVGYPFYFKAIDRSNHFNLSKPIYLKRIIEETPIATSPQGLEISAPTPTLKWQSSSLLYSHTFTTNIYRDDGGVISTIWEKSNINSNLREITLNDSLAPGNYFWTVSILDAFGDKSRSKEAAFRIK